jgi:DNA-binding MarR family transcriptional regulator
MTAWPRFDELVHAPNRLKICALLAAADSAEFSTIREGLGVADSVLSKHVRVLHEAGYVAVHKVTCASRVRTSLSLTAAGRTAYGGHVAALGAIMEGRGAGPQELSGREPTPSTAAAKVQRRRSRAALLQ